MPPIRSLQRRLRLSPLGLGRSADQPPKPRAAAARLTPSRAACWSATQVYGPSHRLSLRRDRPAALHARSARQRIRTSDVRLRSKQVSSEDASTCPLSRPLRDRALALLRKVEATGGGTAASSRNASLHRSSRVRRRLSAGSVRFKPRTTRARFGLWVCASSTRTRETSSARSPSEPSFVRGRCAAPCISSPRLTRVG